MIEFTCPHCGNGSSFPDDKAGTEQACPHCGKPVRVPSGALPGFPGDIRKPAAFTSAAQALPTVPRPHAGEPDSRILPPGLSAMRHPPAEEVRRCAFLKWFLLIVGCVATIAEIYSGVQWYLEAGRGVGVEWMDMLFRLLMIFATFFGGIVLYTIFACLGRIVGSLYIVSKNTETRK
jgi:hypothetical protein